MNLKTCSFCKEEKYLWKSNPKACKTCWGKFISDNKDKPSNLSAKPKSALKRIKSVSDKKLAELAKYRVVRDLYLREHPICEFYTCDCREVELHHGKGKIGELLTNPKYFKALCREHHIFVELKPIEAKELGLSFNRLDIP